MPIFDPVKPPHFSILIMACAQVQVFKNTAFKETFADLKMYILCR